MVFKEKVGGRRRGGLCALNMWKLQKFPCNMSRFWQIKRTVCEWAQLAAGLLVHTISPVRRIQPAPSFKHGSDSTAFQKEWHAFVSCVSPKEVVFFIRYMTSMRCGALIITVYWGKYRVWREAYRTSLRGAGLTCECVLQSETNTVFIDRTSLLDFRHRAEIHCWPIPYWQVNAGVCWYIILIKHRSRSKKKKEFEATRNAVSH